MNVITERTLIRELPERLRHAWHRPAGWLLIRSQTDTEKVYKAILALDADIATRADVITAMGFDGGWIDAPDCDECGAKSPVLVVSLGERPDIDSHTSCVCAGCLEKAVTLASESA